MSGLAGTSAVHGNTNPGFGLSSTNVFLEGGIVANTGSIAGVNMKDSQLYIGTGTHGNSNTAFYVSGKDDATAGDFSLGDKLVWDNSTSTLTISGQITLESGGDTIPDGLISGSAQIAGDISGSQTATSSSLASRQSSYETQVVLDSNGMDLRDQSSVSLANYGTSARIGRSGESRVEISDSAIDMYDGAVSPAKRVNINSSGVVTLGGDNGATDDAIVLDPGSGVTIYESNTNKATITSAGLKIFSGHASNTTAEFGSEVYVGLQANEHVKITNASMEFKDSTTTHGSMTAGVWTIGQVANNLTRLQMATGSLAFIHRDGSGNDTFSLEMKPDGTD